MCYILNINWPMKEHRSSGLGAGKHIILPSLSWLSHNAMFYNAQGVFLFFSFLITCDRLTMIVFGAIVVSHDEGLFIMKILITIFIINVVIGLFGWIDIKTKNDIAIRITGKPKYKKPKLLKTTFFWIVLMFVKKDGKVNNWFYK